MGGGMWGSGISRNGGVVFLNEGECFFKWGDFNPSMSYTFIKNIGERDLV